MRFLVIAAVALCACQQPATAIELSIACDPATTFDSLTVRVRSSTLSLDVSKRFTGVSLPNELLMPVSDTPAEVQVDVETSEGTRVRTATGTVTTVAHQRTPLRLDVSLPLTCRNGERDGTEAGIDCGGDCPKCDLGTPCRADADCATRACAPQGICTLASGPPNWSHGTTFPPPRSRLGGTATPQGVVSAGGRTETGSDLDLVQRYDEVEEEWSTLTPLPIPRSNVATAWFDDKLWVIGGNPTASRVDTIGPNDTQWTTSATPRDHLASAAAVAGEKLFVVGGNALDVFTRGAGWSSGAPPTTQRTSLGLAAMRDGTLYAVGGTAGADSRVVEQYLPGSNVWVPATPMPTARSGLAAVAAPDGRLWAIGGSSAGTALDAVEAYFPPPIDTWVTMPFMKAHRAGVAAALAPDGRLVVFGGAENSGSQPNRVEVYGPDVRIKTKLAVGDEAMLSGTNFAAEANVSATLEPGGAVLASGVTDQAGALAAVTFTVPTLTPGAYTLTVVDDRSRYPITMKFEVTP